MIDDREIVGGLAELKTDIKYIKKSLDDNKDEHKELGKLISDFVIKVDESLDTKVDKIDYEHVRNKILAAAGTLFLMLIGIISFLVKYIFF